MIVRRTKNMIDEMREALFLNVAVKKEYRERICYEFGRKKKRMKGIDRFSHGCDVILNNNKTTDFSSFSKIFMEDTDKEYYVVSFDYLEGIVLSKEQCFNYLCNSSTAIVIGRRFVFIKEEPEKSFIVYCFEIKNS